MRDIVLIGAGGHSKSCIDVIEQTNLFNIIGIVDKQELFGEKVFDYEIKWNDSDIPNLIAQDKCFAIAIGQIKSPSLRIKLFDFLKENNACVPAIVSPEAYVSSHSVIGSGTIVFHDAIINAGAVVGDNCIINTKALIEHDVIIENNCHVSTGALINGSVLVGANSFIGSGAVVVNNISLQKDSFFKAKSLIK